MHSSLRERINQVLEQKRAALKFKTNHFKTELYWKKKVCDPCQKCRHVGDDVRGNGMPVVRYKFESKYDLSDMRQQQDNLSRFSVGNEYLLKVYKPLKKIKISLEIFLKNFIFEATLNKPTF